MTKSRFPALIVDDEKHCRDALIGQITVHCPELEIVGICCDANGAAEAIKEKKPAIVFLDVEMPGINGFELLAQLGEINFKIIFTTAFEQYAIRAIRFGALDFLVKPIDRDELKAAVSRFQIQTRENPALQLEALLSHLGKYSKTELEKIAFPTLHGYELVTQKNIIACESDSNYTKVYVKDSRVLLVSKTLKEIAGLLNELPFFRVHHSFLVNLNEAVRYIKGEGGFLVLTGEWQIPVSRNKKEELLNIITHLR